MAEHLFKALDAAELTDVGLVREKNEDTSKMLIPPPDLPQGAMGALFMVIDGMGGLGGGDVASKYAVAEIARHYYTDESTIGDPSSRLLAALQSASDVVMEQAPRLGLPRIGATAAGLLLTQPGDVLIFNVGDARVYRVRNGQIQRVSKDQSVAERELQAGGLSPERAAQITRNSMVTAFLGQPVPLQPVLVEEKAQPGDVFIICSDGLWSLVEAQQMANAVKNTPARKAVRKLIKMALKRGAPDNVTAIVVRLGKAPGGTGAFARRLAAAIIFAVLLTVGYIGYNTLRNQSTASLAALATGSPTSAVALVSTAQATSTRASTAAGTQDKPIPVAVEPTSSATSVATSTAAPIQPPTLTATAQPTKQPPTPTAPTQSPVQPTQQATEAAQVTEVAMFVPATVTPAGTSSGTGITPSTTPYRVIGKVPADARLCPDANCDVVKTFQPNDTVDVVTSVQGGSVQGRQGTKWYRIFHQGDLLYIHSSYLEPVAATATADTTIVKSGKTID